MTQLALDFELVKEQGPNVGKFHVDQMIESLRGRGWQTSKQLGAVTEGDKRVLRAICRASRGQIISGQQGYKLTLEATVEEVRKTAWLKNQGRDMWRHWIEIQRVAHPLLAGAPQPQP